MANGTLGAQWAIALRADSVLPSLVCTKLTEQELSKPQAPQKSSQPRAEIIGKRLQSKRSDRQISAL
jgi:hypothetical protein